MTQDATIYFWTIFLGDYLPWLCLALVALAPFVDRRSENARQSCAFCGQTLLTLFIAELLAQLGKLFEVWPERPGFPSGHTTWATVLMLCLVLRDRRWLWAAIPIVLLMCASLIYSEAHFPRDVLGGLVLSVAVTLWIRAEARAVTVARRVAAPNLPDDSQSSPIVPVSAPPLV